nr:ribonuclease H-like domain-containing protein [Tanacetum cinerariifolium]
GNPQIDLQDKEVIHSGCSRHMTRNMSYLTGYKEIDGGYVAFGGNPKGRKSQEMADEGFFVGYSLNSKGFRVFNRRKRIVEENLHIRFNESTSNVVGSGPNWLFNIDALIKTMNYEPIVACTKSNGFVDTTRSDNTCQARKEKELVNDYILLPLWTVDPPFLQDPKSSHDDGFKPSSDDGKKVNEYPNDLNMSALEYVSIFNFSNDDEVDDAVADMNNLD